jgi:uncharacterized protein
MTVFVDTSYWLALEIDSEQHHVAALAYWKRMASGRPTLVTTSYVLDEVVTFINSRGFHASAVRVGNILLNSPTVQFVHVDEALLQQGWAYFQRHHDKRYSLTDCISFVVMQQLGIGTALSFDRHFVQAGFQTAP